MISVPIIVSPHVNSHSEASYLEKKTVSELYQRMKEHSGTTQPGPVRTSNSASNLTSLCVDISPSCSNFFEVLYIGKIKVWHKKVPDTFIDDALIRFKQHDLEKNRKKLGRLKSEMDLRRGSIGTLQSASSEVIIRKLQRSYSLISDLGIKSPDVDRKVPSSITEGADEPNEEEQGGTPPSEPPELDLVKLERELKMVPDTEDHNRTMVLQVDRTDLRLISPDRKVILLHKPHKEVATCIQGVDNSEHFGFICREGNSINTFIGYVFKCESSSVASEAVAAITQAYTNVDTKPTRPNITSCEHCPMVWYHKLCCEVENLTDRKTQAAILRRIDQLDDDEQEIIMTKYRGAETDSLREQNEFLMMLLRAHCEMKQGRHAHDTAETRSEFLNQYLGGGGTIFMKAKRSLSNSFDHLLKRRLSRDDFTETKVMTLPIRSFSRETSPAELSDRESEGRSRSSTVSSIDLKENRLRIKDREEKRCPSPDKIKSPIMDIFFKVGSAPKTPPLDGASWRQAIFKRVITPSKGNTEGRKLTRVELRELWRKGIHQAILLVRMEKENARIKAKQEESAVKRIKLEYDEMRIEPGDSIEAWDAIGDSRSREKLVHAVRFGVPRGKRGDVWHVLAEEYCAGLPPVDSVKHPNYGVAYETLLKQLTSHQHAILIDLGRTFPSHPYYSSPLGPGQLALFNLLKAYSLLDPEVGYCQGLSFVTGVLLLHMEESQAFFLLRHLMYRRELRRQYLPDMVGLQVKLYQLSRLLHDRLPDVYYHLDAYEVAPTLYAAPWLLTIFASQFPLGFVTRVFDLIFVEDADVIFRVILSLLGLHKDQILRCDSFEDIMNYMKHKLPAMDKENLEKIMKQVYAIDISKQLSEYHVEYFVLQEEIQSVQPQVDAFHRLEIQNKALTEQNKNLIGQLESTLLNVQRLEKNRSVQQSNQNKLEVQNRSLEVSVATLGNFINTLIDEKSDVEIPGEVRRIVSQISLNERRRSNSNIFSMFKKESRDNRENRVSNPPHRMIVKSLSTGRIAFKQEEKKFFSSSHKDILQHKLHTTNLLNKLNVGEIEEQNEVIEDALVSPTHSVDSGVCTLDNSPADVVNNNEIVRNDNDPSNPTGNHPLSNSDISFSYNTRELKKVKSTRDMFKPGDVVK